MADEHSVDGPPARDRGSARGRRVLLLCLSLAVLAAGVARWLAPGFLPHGMPVVCERPIHDFGTCPPGTTLACSFTLENRSDRTVPIAALSPSCSSCTTIHCADQSIAGSSSTVVKVELEVGKEKRRLIRKVFAVLRCPQQETIELVMTVDVE